MIVSMRLIHGNIVQHLNYEYQTDLESNVDYTHAAHAKLSTLMKEIKEKLITKDKE